jgi:hypothetical protein
MNENAQKLDLTVVYNGASFPETIPPAAAAQSVFTRAVAHFGVAANENLGLFFNGAELNLHATFPAQGVASGATVFLQPRAVRNGAVR